MSPARRSSASPRRAAWRRPAVALAPLSRRLAEGKARLLQRWVIATPDQRLDRVMRSPLRLPLLRQIFTTMRQRVDRVVAPGVEAVIEFRIRRHDGRTLDRYRIVMSEGRCTTPRRVTRAPRVTLTMDAVSFLHLVTGTTGVPALLLARRLSIRGDLLFAAQLPRLLDIPGVPTRRSGRRRSAPR